MPAASVRRPAVAGLFYPDRPDEMEEQLRRLVGEGLPACDARALVVPHAAWRYSGRVAGEVYGRIRVPRVAVVLGPNHAGVGPSGSIMIRGRWTLPGGDVSIAEELAQAILEASSELEPDEHAHRDEHAIEVQLPFLRWREPALTFVPILLMRRDLAFCEAVGRAVAEAVGGYPEPAILVCSTDLNHYEPEPISNWKDGLAIDAILALDPARLLSTVGQHAVSMCGIAPTVATLAAMRELGAAGARLVRYETSAAVSGDYARVVGYAGVIIE
jgi:AmmeMemoRadiSam system protein B